MSTAVAIAAVTQALKNLLADGLLDDHVTGSVGDVSVTALPPDRVALEGTSAKSQLNLFLYQVTPNAAWRNMDLPTRDSDGNRVANSPLALNLHYLLMAYGLKELHSEILLGYGMQVLHETPMLARDGLRQALTGVNAGTEVPPQLRTIAISGLADQVELVKLTPEILSTEEISRLWTAFGAKYRPSSAYVASCVLISKAARTRDTKPVLNRQVLVTPMVRPWLTELEPSVAQVGQTLTLKGNGLGQPGASVTLSGREVAPLPGGSDRELQVAVPDSLRAGVNTAAVSHPIDFGTGTRRGAQSNTLAFMLAPTLGPVPSPLAAGATLILSVTPEVGFAQEVDVLLDDTSLPVAPRPAPPNGPATTSTVRVEIPTDFPPGTKLVRIRVDGAESALTTDAQGRFNGPTVTIT